MLNKLFARLTPAAASAATRAATGASGARGEATFAAVAGIARRPDFYRLGGVPDTIDGRFALLATVVALLLVRIEREGESGNPLSVALTERFIAAMEAEHRELGLGDPTLGKTVRKLVGKLSKRVDLWRLAVADDGGWEAATRSSILVGQPDPAALDWTSAQLRATWTGFTTASLESIGQGTLG